MKSLWTAMAAACALGACAAAAAPPSVDPGYGAGYGRGVSCAIRVVKDRNGVTLAPVVATAAGLRGEYQFVVEKGGREGSTSSEQGGPIALRAGDREALGSITLGGGPMRYAARLTISDRRGPVCVATAPKGRV